MADIQLVITIKDAHVARMIEMMGGYAGKNIEYRLDTPGQRHDQFNFILPTKNGLTNKSFAEKILRVLLLNLIRCYELGKDTLRFKTDIDSVIQPSQNVPDDIIQ